MFLLPRRNRFYHSRPSFVSPLNRPLRRRRRRIPTTLYPPVASTRKIQDPSLSETLNVPCVVSFPLSFLRRSRLLHRLNRPFRPRCSPRPRLNRLLPRPRPRHRSRLRTRRCPSLPILSSSYSSRSWRPRTLLPPPHPHFHRCHRPLRFLLRFLVSGGFPRFFSSSRPSSKSSGAAAGSRPKIGDDSSGSFSCACSLSSPPLLNNEATKTNAEHFPLRRKQTTRFRFERSFKRAR